MYLSSCNSFPRPTESVDNRVQHLRGKRSYQIQHNAGLNRQAGHRAILVKFNNALMTAHVIVHHASASKTGHSNFFRQNLKSPPGSIVNEIIAACNRRRQNRFKPPLLHCWRRNVQDIEWPGRGPLLREQSVCNSRAAEQVIRRYCSGLIMRCAHIEIIPKKVGRHSFPAKVRKDP